MPSFFALAQIACSERKYKDALELIDSCIQFNSKNVKALVLKAYILRKLGCEDGAEKALKLAMEIDKLDYFALAEQGFLDGKECALSKYEKQLPALIPKLFPFCNATRKTPTSQSFHRWLTTISDTTRL